MKRSKLFFWLFLPGLAMILAGLAGLYRAPALLQYAFGPENRVDAAALDALERELGEACGAVSLHGASDGESLSAQGRSQWDIHLVQAGGGYQEIYPRALRAGRPVSRQDAAAGSRVIVLDEELAFRLFRDQDPLGRWVTLREKEYEVIGVAASVRRLGVRGEMTAWIPLGLKDAPAAENLIFTAFGAKDASLWTRFETKTAETLGPGTGWNLAKERTRGTVLLRIAALIAGLWLAAGWIRRLKGLSARWIGQIRDKARVCYPRQMAGYFAGRALGLLLLWTGAAALTAGAVVWISRLLLIFPEWAPDNFLSADAWIARFRSLTAAFAAPAVRRTPEVIEIRFWSGLIRWGTVAALLGAALRRRAGD